MQEKQRTVATWVALPMDYQLILMVERQYVNAPQGLLTSSKKLLKGKRMNPEKHAERALTYMEEQVSVLSNDRVDWWVSRAVGKRASHAPGGKAMTFP